MIPHHLAHNNTRFRVNEYVNARKTTRLSWMNEQRLRRDHDLTHNRVQLCRHESM